MKSVTSDPYLSCSAFRLRSDLAPLAGTDTIPAGQYSPHPMDALFFGSIALAILFGPWIAVAILRSRQRDQSQQMEQRFGDVVQRLHRVESALRKLEQTLSPQVTRSVSAESPLTSPQAVVESYPVKPEPESRVAEEIEPPEPIPAVEPEVPASAEPLRPLIPPLPEIPPRPSVPVPEPIVARSEGPTTADRIRTSGGIEEKLGQNWLNKAGIILLVVGLAFLIETTLKTMGPAGKILVGFAVSLVLLGAGVWFERNERYRILARAGISGGWGLLFFTTYAMYHVPAAQVLSSQLLDLVLMLIVALAMVTHTLRYNSQVVTGLAFLLAYLTIFVSRVSVYSLTAGVVLALGIAIIAVRRNWFQLEVFGILATYLNHFFWLRTIIEPMGDQRHQFPEFFPSAVILVAYWLIYRASYIARNIETREQEGVSTLSALLNSASLLTLLKYQSLHPEWAFWVLLALGAAELLLGQLPITRRRRVAFVVLSTIGAVLIVAAIPFRYSGANVSVLWLMEAEALFLAGLFSEEIVFTRLGLIAGLATAGQMIGDDTFHLLADRLSGLRSGPDYGLGLLVLCLGAVVLYANAHWLSRRWNALKERDLDRNLLVITSYAAAALAVAGLWMAFPNDWTAVAWSALALALAVVARHFQWDDFAIQANIISAASLVRVLVVNLSSDEHFHGVSLRLITVGIVASLYYLTSHWTALTFGETSFKPSAVYTWTASVLVASLIWYEAQPVYIAMLWCIFGVVLFQIGLRDRSQHLRGQAYVAMVASFLRMMSFNLLDAPHPGDYSARVYTVIPIAIAAFYIFANRSSIETRERHLMTAHAWLGTITVAALTWYELQPDWTVTAWACLTLMTLLIASLLKIGTFTQQGIVFSLVVLLRAIVVNFNNFVAGWSNRSLAVAAAAAILFASLYFCFRIRSEDGGHDDWRGLFDFPEQTLFFVPLLMTTVLLGLEMRHGLITVSWGIEGVLVFLFALMVNERSYRLSGLALLLLCVGKVVVIDVWRLYGLDRYITFIIMGCALLLVSFLYTRHKETIRQYL